MVSRSSWQWRLLSASFRPGPCARPHLISAGCDFNGDEDAHTYAHEALIHRTRIHRLGFPCQEPWRICESGTDLSTHIRLEGAPSRLTGNTYVLYVRVARRTVPCPCRGWSVCDASEMQLVADCMMPDATVSVSASSSFDPSARTTSSHQFAPRLPAHRCIKSSWPFVRYARKSRRSIFCALGFLRGGVRRSW